MKTIKHISSKNADYGADETYLTFEHDEFTMKPTFDKTRWLIRWQGYRLDTLNCVDEDFACPAYGQICGTARIANGKTSRASTISSALPTGCSGQWPDR